MTNPVCYTFWSDEDEGYIARSTLPEHRYISAFGKTEDEALKELYAVLEALKEVKP